MQDLGGAVQDRERPGQPRRASERPQRPPPYVPLSELFSAHYTYWQLCGHPRPSIGQLMQSLGIAARNERHIRRLRVEYEARLYGTDIDEMPKDRET